MIQLQTHSSKLLEANVAKICMYIERCFSYTQNVHFRKRHTIYGECNMLAILPFLSIANSLASKLLILLTFRFASHRKSNCFSLFGVSVFDLSQLHRVSLAGRFIVYLHTNFA